MESTELKITAMLIGEKDKNYWLYAYRLKNNIMNIQRFSSLIATGKITRDSNCCAIIDGFRWVHENKK